MVSKRQKLARKRYKEAHPELFVKPDPTIPPTDPNRKKKKTKKNNFKRKKAESKEIETSDKPRRTKFRKHPLRVPGMKPGESCFICKARDHIAKHCPERAQWEKNKICLLCRRRGHSLKNCPNKNEETMDKKLCYNCGETGHSLAKCPQPRQDGGTKFANCFICNERGHLSKDCPQNTHGIYPKGGCCKTCGGVTHLAKDCPHKGNKGSNAANGGITSTQNEERRKGQVTKFVSGDDLDDDFTTEDKNSGSKIKLLGPKGGPSTDFKDNNVKAKKKGGPKVVIFAD